MLEMAGYFNDMCYKRTIEQSR